VDYVIQYVESLLRSVTFYRVILKLEAFPVVNIADAAD
jgi:hypothetical protein